MIDGGHQAGIGDLVAAYDVGCVVGRMVVVDDDFVAEVGLLADDALETLFDIVLLIVDRTEHTDEYIFVFFHRAYQ